MERPMTTNELLLYIGCIMSVLLWNFLVWREFPYEEGFDRFLMHAMATIWGFFVGGVVSIAIISYAKFTLSLIAIIVIIWAFIFLLDRYASDWRDTRR